MNYFGSIFAMVVCIAMSAYFSATETAFSSLNKTRLKVLADNGNKRAALALKLSEDYDKLISTILIGNNIVNIMVASIGTLLFVGLYGDIGATVSTIVVTVVVLIFGEITPKSVAKDTPERFAMFSAPFIRLWIWVLTPLNFLFSQWKKLVSRFFKTNDDAKMSHEELLLFMEDVEQDGGIDENEGELLRNALEFRDLTAAEILTHRIELEAVDIDESHARLILRLDQDGINTLDLLDLLDLAILNVGGDDVGGQCQIPNHIQRLAVQGLLGDGLGHLILLGFQLVAILHRLFAARGDVGRGKALVQGGGVAQHDGDADHVRVGILLLGVFLNSRVFLDGQLDVVHFFPGDTVVLALGRNGAAAHGPGGGHEAQRQYEGKHHGHRPFQGMRVFHMRTLSFSGLYR